MINTPKETIKLLGGYPEILKEKSCVINHLVASTLVPIQRNILYKLPRRKKVLKRIRKEWGQPGRTKVSGKPEANKLVKRLNNRSSFVITANDIIEKISETRVRESDDL